MARITLYVTILDADLLPTGRHYRTAFQSHSLSNARAKTQWDGNQNRLVIANWRRKAIEAIQITHVPSGKSHAAKIHRLKPK